MPINNKYNPDQIEQQMVEEYLQGASSKDLMVKYGYKTRKSVTDKVKKHLGADFDFKKHLREKKDYCLDLSTINSPFIAYFIGLMITDGYIVDERKFGIDLVDEDCINFIAKSTGQIYSRYSGYQENQQIKYRIIFSDSGNIKQLERYGIIKNKTHLLKGFNWLPEEEKFIPYFIRGVIDGDGSIYSTTYGELKFNISASSFDFITWLEELLINKLYMFEVSKNQNAKTGVWSLDSALKRNIDILKLLSYDRPFGMARKFNKLYEQASETIMETSEFR